MPPSLEVCPPGTAGMDLPAKHVDNTLQSAEFWANKVLLGGPLGAQPGVGEGPEGAAQGPRRLREAAPRCRACLESHRCHLPLTVHAWR